MIAEEFPWKIGIGMIPPLLSTKVASRSESPHISYSSPKTRSESIYAWNEKISAKRAHKGYAIISPSETKVVRKYKHGMIIHDCNSDTGCFLVDAPCKYI